MQGFTRLRCGRDSECLDNKQVVKDAYLEANFSRGLVKRIQLSWAATLDKDFCIQLDLVLD